MSLTKVNGTWAKLPFHDSLFFPCCNHCSPFATFHPACLCPSLPPPNPLFSSIPIHPSIKWGFPSPHHLHTLSISVQGAHLLGPRGGTFQSSHRHKSLHRQTPKQTLTLTDQCLVRASNYVTVSVCVRMCLSRLYHLCLFQKKPTKRNSQKNEPYLMFSSDVQQLSHPTTFSVLFPVDSFSNTASASLILFTTSVGLFLDGPKRGMSAGRKSDLHVMMDLHK